jgi:transposase
MSTKEKKTYDAEFKKQAVQMLIRSGRPLAQIARELGVEAWVLREWKKRLQPELAQQPETLEAMRLRIAQLERDNLQLRQQRDILKKTLGIVSNT